MSKNFRRSAVALVLAATMVFGSQGFTAFADNGDNSGMPELLSVQTSGEGGEEELTIGQSSDNENLNETTPASENIATVVEQIGALPDPATLDPSTTNIEQLTEQVAAARKAYDALTEEERAIFDAAALEKLIALEGALTGLAQVNVIPEATIQPNISYPSETSPVDYTKRQSDSVTYDGYESDGDGNFIFHYTIHEGAGSDLVIDLAYGALDLWQNESQMPGDHYKFQIFITNESGNTYHYKDNSFVLAPEDTSNFGSIEEGSLLPVLTYDGQLMPIRFSGSIIPKYFYENIFHVDRSGDVTFDMLCRIYDFLAEAGYTGDEAITDYLLDYFNEQRGVNYSNLTDLFADHPDWLDGSMVTSNGIYTMPEEELLGYIEQYPWIDKFVYATKTETGDLNVQIKWPEPEISAVSYNSFYMGLFSVVYGQENAEALNPSGSGVEFSRSHAVGDYLPGTELYSETNQYFNDLTTDGFKPGDTLEIWSGYGIDGPGMGNSYQNYSFTYYNIIELEQPTVPTPDPDPDPTPDPDPDPTPDRPSRPDRDDDDDWEPLPDAPVKDKPEKVEVETVVPEETETPTEQPDKYNPETGDTTTVFAAMALAAVSLGGVVLLGRKKK